MNILSFIPPIILISLGFMLRLKPIKTIGSNGYSSPFSKKSQETWDYAQNIAPKVVLFYSFILLLTISSLNLISVLCKSLYLQGLFTSVNIGFTLFIIFKIELKLRSKFNDLGENKHLY